VEEYIAFAQNHPILTAGFFGVLGLIIWTEIGRFTRKYNQIDTKQAVRLMNDDETVVVDVRTQKELTQDGKLKGARHIDLKDLDKRLSELDKFKEKPVLVYCRSGNRSAHACGVFTKNGFTNVNNLAGGITAWTSDNLPVSRK